MCMLLEIGVILACDESGSRATCDQRGGKHSSGPMNEPPTSLSVNCRETACPPQ